LQPETLKIQTAPMPVVKHISSSHPIHPDTETLIIGTFNPGTPENTADFFYGRRQNYLWRLLPMAFGKPDLKNASREDKLEFMNIHKIDFIDLIAEVNVEEGMEANYNDDYIDNLVIQWKDVISEMEKLKNLRKACFTRKTFSNVPNIWKKVLEIEKYCLSKEIDFKCLITTSRVYSKAKQHEWSQFFV